METFFDSPTRHVRSIFFFILLVLIPMARVRKAHAQEFTTTYNAQYTLSDDGTGLVNLHVQIVNTRADVYVKHFGLSFPESFKIDDVSARDDSGDAAFELGREGNMQTMRFALSEPKTGPGSQSNLFITFRQDNLFFISGGVWELILPTIRNEGSLYNLKVNLPQGAPQKVSIAKPAPTQVQGNTIVWENVTTKTVYMVFGESQLYKVSLVYNLQNDSLLGGAVDIALPPETLYQSVIVDSIVPKPQKTFTDEDGNFLARYTLKPRESLKVTFTGFVKTFARPQEAMLPYVRNTFDNQKRYLLSEAPYWETGDAQNNEIKSLDSANSIFRYVVDKLDYNFGRVNKDIKRLGAVKIMSEPALAVCMEYTDLFIALAREKGIGAREINGYAFAHSRQLRPLSLVSDVLHAWPEYFDEKSRVWIPVDPTWEDTSGIDYFSQFDLNHIAFAIHGKSSTQPLAAGMYKLEDSRDVTVNIAAEEPAVKTEIRVTHSIPGTLEREKTGRAHVALKNTGNTFVKGSLLSVTSPDIVFEPSRIAVDLVAPGEERSFDILYRTSHSQKAGSSAIRFVLDDQLVRAQKVEITSSAKTSAHTVIVMLVVTSIALLILFSRRKKVHI